MVTTMTNHTPHTVAENPRIRLTPGLISMKIVKRGTPAQNSALTRITPKIKALPRSGCAITRRKGTATMASGLQSCTSLVSGSLLPPR
jgi:hypothetical protein